MSCQENISFSQLSQAGKPTYSVPAVLIPSCLQSIAQAFANYRATIRVPTLLPFPATALPEQIIVRTQLYEETINTVTRKLEQTLQKLKCCSDKVCDLAVQALLNANAGFQFSLLNLLITEVLINDVTTLVPLDIVQLLITYFIQQFQQNIEFILSVACCNPIETNDSLVINIETEQKVYCPQAFLLGTNFFSISIAEILIRLRFDPTLTSSSRLNAYEETYDQLRNLFFQSVKQLSAQKSSCCQQAALAFDNILTRAITEINEIILADGFAFSTDEILRFIDEIVERVKQDFAFILLLSSQNCVQENIHKCAELNVVKPDNCCQAKIRAYQNYVNGRRIIITTETVERIAIYIELIKTLERIFRRTLLDTPSKCEIKCRSFADGLVVNPPNNLVAIAGLIPTVRSRIEQLFLGEPSRTLTNESFREIGTAILDQLQTDIRVLFGLVFGECDQVLSLPLNFPSPVFLPTINSN